MAEFSIFLDESGVESYTHADNHYVVAGLVVEKDYFVNQAMDEIKKLKIKFFKNDEIVLHFFDMLRWRDPFTVLRNRTLEKEFWNDYTALINSLDFKVLAAVVDKSAMSQRYALPQAPKRVALPVLYENLVHFLSLNKGTGKIFVEEYNETEDHRVYVQYHLTMANGTSRVSRDAFLRQIKGLKFLAKKDNILGLQIADTIAYLINTEAKGKIGKQKSGPDLTDLWSVVQGKIYDGNRNETSRYGCKLLP